MKAEIIHPTLGAVTISCTRRSTRISISVRPSGQVRLSFPPYISQRRAMAFLERKAEWIKASKARYLQSESPALSKEQIEILRQQAKATLPKRVEELANRHGLRYGRVTIRATRSKWGSCTAERNISLSLFMMTLPEHLRDYIILHELAHTVHLNHSAEFHALLDRLTQGEDRALARELRKYTIR